MTTRFDSLPRSTRRVVLCASIVLYAVSLCLPAMYFEKEAPLPGVTLLAQGWFGLADMNPAWLANPFYAVAFVLALRKRYGRAGIFCGVGVACALYSPLTTMWYFSEAEGTPVTGLGIAFYAWLAAQVVLLVGSLCLRRESPSPPANR
jgi:hypothetical protein